jgi:DNA helicase-2/ATP-dependent DNA helicase PcrA
MNPDILTGLTSSQTQAVAWGEGPLLVLAGPGSGKTRVITRRIAYLIQQGIHPRQILALTFTNKAAEEMRSRLKQMNTPSGSLICTFHSLCARLLREFFSPAGLPENFTIFDRSDQLSIIRDILHDMDLDPKAYQPPRILRRIGRWKNELMTPGQVLESLSADAPAAIPAEIFQEYQQRLSQSGGLDFDDLLMKTAVLLKKKLLRQQLSLRYRHILVDEYQDTNRCQFRIARDLSCGHRNIFVTGDPDQSIYGWRGADIENILAFEKDFPEAAVIRLEDNFRSTPPILNLADNMIQVNRQRKSKRLIARIEGGDRPRLFSFGDEYSEADGAIAWIKEMQSDFNLALKDMAVFYRTNAMSRILEETLYRKGIPYQIVRGLEFYQRREIKDMLAYLRVLVNPADRVSLLRIINRPPRGIGQKTIERLTAQTDAGGSGLWPLLQNPDTVTSLNTGARSHLRSFSKMIRGFQSIAGNPIAEMLRIIFKQSGYFAYLDKGNQRDAIQNVEELIHSAEEYDQTADNPTLGGYLQRIALLSDPDTYDDKSGAVSLMTLHAAKGLEFPAVLITGVENGILPHNLSQGNLQALEEERRLLFVGITRAKKYLALSYAQSRSIYGHPRPTGSSPFLRGLENHLRRAAPGTHLFSSDSAGASPKTLDILPQAGPYASGRRVKHPQLGEGLIDKVIPGTDPPKLVVQFSSNRRLTLDLRFAKLELL